MIAPGKSMRNIGHMSCCNGEFDNSALIVRRLKCVWMTRKGIGFLQSLVFGCLHTECGHVYCIPNTHVRKSGNTSHDDDDDVDAVYVDKLC